jgi:hypothetical protein
MFEQHNTAIMQHHHYGGNYSESKLRSSFQSL